MRLSLQILYGFIPDPLRLMSQNKTLIEEHASASWRCGIGAFA
jgi:hypothetical protein